MKKIWLLDFDGVINALSSGNPPTWDDWVDVRISHFPIKYSPSVIETIAEVHHNSDVEIWWLSTWCEGTVLFQDHIPGLPLRPWLGDSATSDFHDMKDHWKLAAARDFIPDDADVMWTEDEIYLTSVEARPWIESRKGPTHTINPNPNLGLTPKHIAVIREWAGLEKETE